MKIKVLIIVAALIFVCGVAGSIWALNAPRKNRVEIKSGGRVLYTLDLSREGNRTVTVSADKGVNVIEIRDGRIRVQSADCADQTCVRMGWLDSAAMPIVCLPHGLVIAYTNADSEVDALAQ